PHQDLHSFPTRRSSDLTINDNDTNTGTNPIDRAHFFVQMHYYDFLNRFPDQSGWDFWTNNIDNCTPKSSCTDLQRINTSAAYFLDRKSTRLNSSHVAIS